MRALFNGLIDWLNEFVMVQWCIRHAEFLMRFAWTNIYALLILSVGVVFAAWVPQTRDLLGNLLVHTSENLPVERKSAFHVVAYVIALVGWMAAIWYSIRLLASHRLADEPAPHPLVARLARWFDTQFPRLAAFAGFSAVVVTSSVFLAGEPTWRWLPYLCVGLPPLVWGLAAVLDRVMPKARDQEGRRRYDLAATVIAVVACAIAFSAWYAALHSASRDHGLAWLLGYVKDPAGRWRGSLLEEFVPGVGGYLLILSAAGSLVALRARRTWLLRAARATAATAWIAALLFADGAAALWLCVAILAIGAASLWYASRRRELHALPTRVDQRVEKMALGTWRALAVAITLLALMIAGFSLWPVPLGRYIGTLAIAFLALSLWCFVATVLFVFVPRVNGWPSLAAVPLLWAVLIGQSANHEMRATAYEEPQRRPPMETHFEQWRAALPDADNSPIVFVAASGGGLRAAFWTAHVLAAADDASCGEFGRHVYAYSGVSGGSLGVAAFLAQRKVWSAKPPEERCRAGRVREMTQFLGRDFLAPAGGSMVFAEAFQLFVPVSYLERERGVALADAWRASWDDAFEKQKGAFARPFLQHFSADARHPAVFLNATGVASGRRVIAANVVTQFPAVDDLFYKSALDRGPKLRTGDLPISDAVLNSARFTYVSPAGTVIGCFRGELGKDCRGGAERAWDRVVDGGYFENSGLATLRDVMRHLRTDESAGTRKYRNPVFTVVIQNGSDEESICRWGDGVNLRGRQKHDLAPRILSSVMMRLRHSIDTDPNDIPAMSETTAPFEALLNVREARAELELRRLRSEISCDYIIGWSLNEQLAKLEPRTKRIRFGEPPLGWFLSNRSAERMVKAAQAYGDALPFTLASCDDGKKPTRGVIGDPQIAPPGCQPGQTKKP